MGNKPSKQPSSQTDEEEPSSDHYFFNEMQEEILWDAFHESQTPSRTEVEKLAEMIGASFEDTSDWFIDTAADEAKRLRTEKKLQMQLKAQKGRKWWFGK